MVFVQRMEFLPWSTFARIVARYGGAQRLQTLSCGEHCRAMAVAELAYREGQRHRNLLLNAGVATTHCPLCAFL
jgi:hypothetical protein